MSGTERPLSTQGEDMHGSNAVEALSEQLGIPLVHHEHGSEDHCDRPDCFEAWEEHSDGG